MLHLISKGHWLVMWRGPAKGEEELSQHRCPQRLLTTLCDEPWIWIQYRELKEATRLKCGYFFCRLSGGSLTSNFIVETLFIRASHRSNS